MAIDLGMACHPAVTVEAPADQAVPTFTVSRNHSTPYHLLALGRVKWDGPRVAAYVREDMLKPISAEALRAAEVEITTGHVNRAAPHLVQPADCPPSVAVTYLLGQDVQPFLVHDGKRWQYNHGSHDGRLPAFTAFYSEVKPKEGEEAATA